MIPARPLRLAAAAYPVERLADRAAVEALNILARRRREAASAPAG